MNSRLEAIKARKNFYRDHYNRACNLLLVVLLMALLGSFLLLYLLSGRLLPAFYASNTDGELFPLTPISKPVLAY